MRRLNWLMANAHWIDRALRRENARGRTIAELGAGDGTFLLSLVRKLRKRGVQIERAITLDRQSIVSQETREGFAALGCSFESAQDKFAWAKLDELAMKHKLEEKPFRRELGEWLLPNEDGDRPRGMRGREFGFDDRVTREFSARLRGEAPMPVDQLASIARAGRIGLCSASASNAMPAPACAKWPADHVSVCASCRHRRAYTSNARTITTASTMPPSDNASR